MKEKTKDNPEKLATYGTQYDGKKHNTIQRNWQHRVHNMKEKTKDNPEKLTT
jgi:hypothetical protein